MRGPENVNFCGESSRQLQLGGRGHFFRQLFPDGGGAGQLFFSLHTQGGMGLQWTYCIQLPISPP